MENVIIWHNPRCSKSRNAVALLEEQGVEAEVLNTLIHRQVEMRL